jgi:hypothetical protein
MCICVLVCICSAVLASRVLGEHVNMLGKMGCVLCVVGATILVIHCPKEQELNTMDELAVLLQNAGKKDFSHIKK